MTDGRCATRLLELLIIQPLVQLLEASTSLKIILQRLAVLESRFTRYRTSDADWNAPFDTNTDFFGNIECQSLKVLAFYLTVEDLNILRRLNIQAMGRESNPVRRANNRWGELCWTIHDCIAAKVGLTERIDRLAQVCFATMSAEMVF